ncbi:50S ribosomal protein L22, partial [Calditrichota bacterium]
DPSAVYVKVIMVDEGPTQKRWRPRAMGRATRIIKRTSHLMVTVAAKDIKDYATRRTRNSIGTENTSCRY